MDKTIYYQSKKNSGEIPHYSVDQGLSTSPNISKHYLLISVIFLNYCFLVLRRETGKTLPFVHVLVNKWPRDHQSAHKVIFLIRPCINIIYLFQEYKTYLIQNNVVLALPAHPATTRSVFILFFPLRETE